MNLPMKAKCASREPVFISARDDENRADVGLLPYLAHAGIGGVRSHRSLGQAGLIHPTQGGCCRARWRDQTLAVKRGAVRRTFSERVVQPDRRAVFRLELIASYAE